MVRVYVLVCVLVRQAGLVDLPFFIKINKSAWRANSFPGHKLALIQRQQ